VEQSSKFTIELSLKIPPHFKRIGVGACLVKFSQRGNCKYTKTDYFIACLVLCSCKSHCRNTGWIINVYQLLLLRTAKRPNRPLIGVCNEKHCIQFSLLITLFSNKVL